MNSVANKVLFNLPAAYELEQLGEVECLRSSAREKAEQGAPEGAILVADQVKSGAGSGGKHWQGFHDNMHVAIVLQPDIPEQRYSEYLVVALVSLGHAISSFVSPMTALTFSWPNDINIARLKIASVWLDHGATLESGEPWLTITASVNVAHAPEDFSIPAMSLHEAEGSNELSRDDILVAWARQFIVQLNDWSERSFSHTLALWKVRMDTDNRLLDIATDTGKTHARLVDVDQHGSALVKISGNDSVETLLLNDYLIRS